MSKPNRFHALVNAKPRFAGEYDDEPVEFQIGQRRVHGTRHRWRTGSVVFEFCSTAAFHGQKVEFRSTMRRPEITVLPRSAGDTYHLLHGESLPGRTAFRMSHEICFVSHTQQGVQQPGVRKINPGCLDLAFLQALVPGLNSAHYQKGGSS